MTMHMGVIVLEKKKSISAEECALVQTLLLYGVRFGGIICYVDHNLLSG